MGITAFVYSSLWESFAKFAIYPWQEETNLLESLKWHYDQILVFPRYLGKFQSIRNINTYAFDLFFREFTADIQVFVRTGENDVTFSKLPFGLKLQ